MDLVVLDLEALVAAQTALRSCHDTLRSESARHGRLAGDVGDLLRQMAGDILGALNPTHLFDPFGPWEQWGMGRFTWECQSSHGVTSDTHRETQRIVSQVAEAHGDLGHVIASHASDAVISAGAAAGKVGEMTSFCGPHNLLWFMEEPWVLVEHFREVESLLNKAASEVVAFVHYLEAVYQREEGVLQTFLRELGPIGAPLLGGGGPLAMTLARGVAAEQSPAQRQAAANLLNFLKQHFRGDVNLLSFDAKHPKGNPLDPQASIGIEGDLWHSKPTEVHDNLGNAPLTTREGLVVADLSGGLGISAGGKEGMLLGGAASFTAVKAYQNATVGSSGLGLTSKAEESAGSAEGLFGVDKNGKVGAEVGVSLVTVQDTIGANIAGVNVGLTGAVGLKAEFGFEFNHGVEVKLPFVSFGLSVGGAE